MNDCGCGASGEALRWQSLALQYREDYLRMAGELTEAKAENDRLVAQVVRARHAPRIWGGQVQA